MKREENQTVEYKESWHEKYLEWICGYANAKGGTLYIGIEDGTKKPVGVKNANKLMEDIANALIHRDYTNYGSEVHIDMYDDRLEVVSPGGMFDGGTPIQDRGDIRGIGSSRRNPLVADIFSRLDFAERRGSGLGKIMDAYSLPLSNADGRLPSFTSDTFFRAILPNMTYGLTKEHLVAFAEREATPNSRTPNSQTPNSRNHKSAVQVDRTSRPYKSAIQVTQSTLPLPKAE